MMDGRTGWLMGIAEVAEIGAGHDGHQSARQRAHRVSDGIARLESGRAGVALEQLGDQVAFDELALFARGLAESERSEPVNLAMSAAARLVNQSHGLAREQVTLAASKLEPIAQVLLCPSDDPRLPRS